MRSTRISSRWVVGVRHTPAEFVKLAARAGHPFHLEMGETCVDAVAAMSPADVASHRCKKLNSSTRERGSLMLTSRVSLKQASTWWVTCRCRITCHPNSSQQSYRYRSLEEQCRQSPSRSPPIHPLFR